MPTKAPGARGPSASNLRTPGGSPARPGPGTKGPGGSGVDALGSGWALPWFELSVLEENVTRARELVATERKRLAEEAPEAERAAEDEERESEAPKPS